MTERGKKKDKLVESLKFWFVPGHITRKVKKLEEKETLSQEKINYISQYAITCEFFKVLTYGVLAFATVKEVVEYYFSL